MPPARAVAAQSRSVDGWATQSWEDRHDTMTWTVLPNMARLVQEFEGTALPELSCFTCHGPNGERLKYAMPSGLPALDPNHMPERDSANPREAKYAAFMQDQVVPRFSHMTDNPNVSCFTCHPKANGQ
jgi:hypothetical protein